MSAPNLRQCQNCLAFDKLRLCPCGGDDCRLLVCARCERSVRSNVSGVRDV